MPRLPNVPLCGVSLDSASSGAIDSYNEVALCCRQLKPLSELRRPGGVYILSTRVSFVLVSPKTHTLVPHAREITVAAMTDIIRAREGFVVRIMVQHYPTGYVWLASYHLKAESEVALASITVWALSQRSVHGRVSEVAASGSTCRCRNIIKEGRRKPPLPIREPGRRCAPYSPWVSQWARLGDRSGAASVRILHTSTLTRLSKIHG